MPTKEILVGNPLGIFTPFDTLNEIEKQLVEMAWKAANLGAELKLSYQSNFPVGCAIHSMNEKGETKVFHGCNVENKFLPAVICAERNVAISAAAEGYTSFLCVAVVCRKTPGGSPCGLCRQVLVEFGQKATLLNISDRENNVYRAGVPDLLPPAKGKAIPTLNSPDVSLAQRANLLKRRSYVPYSKSPRAALFVAADVDGNESIFEGVSDDNASFGGSALAETVAMRSARTAGNTIAKRLLVTVSNPSESNPIDGECLQVMREFGPDLPIVLIGEDSIVETSLIELLPDSFGPEQL